MAILNKNHLYHITKMVNDTNVQYFEKGEWGTSRENML